jgi:hypothetical protein
MVERRRNSPSGILAGADLPGAIAAVGLITSHLQIMNEHSEL